MIDEQLLNHLNERLDQSAENSSPHDVYHILNSANPDTILPARQRVSEHIFVNKQQKEKLKEAFDTADSMLTALLGSGFRLGVYLYPVNTNITDKLKFAAISVEGKIRIAPIPEELAQQPIEFGTTVLMDSKGSAVVSTEQLEEPVKAIGPVVSVARVVDEHRVAVNINNEEQLLYSTIKDLSEGDQIRISPYSGTADEVLPRTDRASSYTADTDPLPVSAMGGFDELRDSILKKFIYNIGNNEVAARYNLSQSNSNLLLEGPPGCGKTLLAKIICSEIQRVTSRNVKFRIIAGSELHNPFVGQTEQNILSVFRPPKDFDGIVVIFLDEIDAIGQARGRSSNIHGDRFLSTLLSVMEGYENNNDVITIAATNRKELLDSALAERFATALFVGRPDEKAALEIFKVHFPESVPVNQSDRDDLLVEAVSKLYATDDSNVVSRLIFEDRQEAPVYPRDLISGRLIEQIANNACEMAFQREVESDGAKVGVTNHDMKIATNNAIHRLGKILSINNVHTHISDIPSDINVVAIRSIDEQ